MVEERGVPWSAALLFFCLPFAVIPWMGDAVLLKWALIWVGEVFALAVLLWRGTRLDRVDLAVIAFAGWAVLSLAWTPDYRGAVPVTERFVTGLLAFLILRRFVTRRVAEWCALAVLSAAVLNLFVFGVDRFGGMGNPNFLAEMILVALPLLPASIPGLVVGSASGAMLLDGQSDVMWPVLGLWVLLGVGTVWSWRAVAGLSAIGVSAFFALLMGSDALQTSVQTRLDIWIGSGAAILKAPWIGHGIGSFNYVFPFYADTSAPLGLLPYSVELQVYAGAAHNEYLQLWFELGLIGCVLAGVAIALAVPKAKWRHLCTIGIISLYGFPLQNPVTMLLAALTIAALCPHEGSSARPDLRAVLAAYWRSAAYAIRGARRHRQGMDRESAAWRS